MAVSAKQQERRVTREPPESLDFGSPEWLRGLTEVAQQVGRPAFEQRLFELLNHVLHIDHFVVFTFCEPEGPGHLFTRSKMPVEEAQGLADDYVNKFYERDPHIAEASGRAPLQGIRQFRPRLNDEYDAEYRQHFFTQHDLVDKISTVGRMDEGNVYCNFWRMGDTGTFSGREEKLFGSVLPLITALVSSHFRMLRTAPHVFVAEGKNVARSLIHSVISRRVEPFDRLTPRESEICERILIGYTSTGISLDLGIAISSANSAACHQT